MFFVGQLCIKQYKQMDNKTQLIGTLQSTHYQLQLRTQHVITVLSDNSVSIPEARRFLNHQYPQGALDWKSLQQLELIDLSLKGQQYITGNRAEWRQKDRNYPDLVKEAEGIKTQLLEAIEVEPISNSKELLDRLEKTQLKRADLLGIHLNTEFEGKVRQQNEQLQHLISVQKQIVEHQQERLNSSKSDDGHYQELINGIISQKNHHQSKGNANKREKEQKLTLQKLEDYNKKLISIKKRLYQIFLFECRENRSQGLTFEAYNHSSQLIDLRLFLKYFKEYQFVEINKYRFKVTSATQLFRSTATNGLSLNFNQFWHIHRLIFDLEDLSLNRNNIMEADSEQLPYLRYKWQGEIDKLKELSDIVSQKRTEEVMKALKTESSPQPVLSKNPSSVALSNPFSKPAGKGMSKYSSVSSKYLSKYHALTHSSKDLSSPKRNFIQNVREELLNAEDGHMGRPSLNNLSLSKNSSQVGSNLPKILKLSSHDISSQGIYQSLKHFSPHEYRTQEKKIRDIIGLSNGDEDETLKVFLRRQRMKDERVKREKSVEREVRRRVFLENSTKKHQCRRFKPEDVEPYMRF